MKHIIGYELFESADFSIIRDILLDLTDDGFRFDTKLNSVLRGKFASEKPDVVVTLTKNEFTYNDIKETVDRLSGYMDTEGYRLYTGPSALDRFQSSNIMYSPLKKINRVDLAYKFSALNLMKAKSKYSI